MSTPRVWRRSWRRVLVALVFVIVVGPFLVGKSLTSGRSVTWQSVFMPM